ncbi:MAG: lamin tail domain-containing protein [Lewinellaceae bacterium]|nr:lamin tail domain-containing protein [Lewinellaceae bacterium]
MKKTLLSIIVCLFTFISLRAQIVITEIMYNPPPSGTDSLEYVEIFNNSGLPVNLSGWTFSQGFNFTFAEGTFIAPGGYLVIAQNAPYFQAQFGFAPLAMVLPSALTNGGEDIELRDAGRQCAGLCGLQTCCPLACRCRRIGRFYGTLRSEYR